jgi:hypothetical protein
MPINRRRTRRPLVGQPEVPDWAVRLLAGEQPARGSEDEDSMIGWMYFGEKVPGLPDPRSHEDYLLWRTRHADEQN